MFNTSFEGHDNTVEFHMFGAEKDRAATGPQSPMPRRRRALTTEGLDSLACMERALDAATTDDVKSSESKAYVSYNGNYYQVPAKGKELDVGDAVLTRSNQIGRLLELGDEQLDHPNPDYTNDYGARFDKLEDINPGDIVVVNGIGGYHWHYVSYANNKRLLQRIPVAVVKKLRERWQDELAAKMAPKQATSDEADGEVGLFVTDDDLAVASRVPPTVFEQLQEKWKKTEVMDRDTNGNERVERRVNPEEVDVLAKEVTDKVALDAVGRAQQLIDEKKEFDASQQKEWDKLPLFHPGKTYKASDAANGFRVMDGYEVSYNQNNDVRIATERHGVYDANKTMTVINKWSDGGLAWMYWTNKAPIGSNGVPLRECVVRYGMGGWVDKKNDRRAKVVFLDDERSVKPGRCFILAMDAPSSGNRILVKGNELNDDVFRVFRSAVPDDVQKVITLRELINVRQLAEANTTKPLSTWWQM